MKQLAQNILLGLVSCLLILFLSDKLLRHIVTEDGIAITPNLDKELFTNIDYIQETSSNEIGLRCKSLDQYPTRQTATLVLGDSYTFGIGVNDKETFTHLLHKDNNGFYINGGKPGAGFIDYYQILTHHEILPRIKNVVLCVFANDLNNMPDYEYTPKMIPEKQSPTILPNIRRLIHQLPKKHEDFYKRVEREAKEQNITDSNFLNWKNRIPAYIDVAIKQQTINEAFVEMGLLYPQYYENIIEMKSNESKVKWNNSKTFLDSIDSICIQHDITLRMVYLPSPIQYDPYWAERTESHPIKSGTILKPEYLNSKAQFTEQLEEWCGHTQTPFLDLTEVFRNHNHQETPTIFSIDTHWNKEGHLIAYRSIKEWLNN